MPNILMFQGTGSGVGKSILVAGFCRLLKNRGYGVLPFKAQNMALNSGVTPQGLEMGRAQIVQAEACGVFPDVRMNPILLKPQGPGVSQLIRLGKIIGNYTAREYYKLAEENFRIVKETFDSLKNEADWIIVEGAGSPAEINLQATDIVNMRMAEYANAKVIMIGDIDRGGVFAWLKGTYDLIQEQHRHFLHGMLINKFRGDVSLLKPGIDQFKKIVPVPIVGVIPWREMKLEDEDSQNLKSRIDTNEKLKIKVIRLPYISNFNDFDPLKNIPGISVEFVSSVPELDNTDLIILPGSKNTILDLRYLQKCGIAEKLRFLTGQVWILGICGGFQMLGLSVEDPLNMESTKINEKNHKACKNENFPEFENHELSSISRDSNRELGLGILEMTTVLQGDKKLVRREYNGKNILEGLNWQGYEIHLGRSDFDKFKYEELVKDGNELAIIDHHKKVIGTYIHGWFESSEVTQKILALVSSETFNIPFSFRETKEREMNDLALFLEDHCDVEKILKN